MIRVRGLREARIGIDLERAATGAISDRYAGRQRPYEFLQDAGG